MPALCWICADVCWQDTLTRPSWSSAVLGRWDVGATMRGALEECRLSEWKKIGSVTCYINFYERHKKVCIEIQRTLESASGLRLPMVYWRFSWLLFSNTFFLLSEALTHLACHFLLKKNSVREEGQVLISSSLNQRGNAWKIQATGLRSHSSVAAMRCRLASSWGAESFDLSQAAWWGHRRPGFGVGHTKSKCHLCTSGHPPAPLLPRLRRGVGTPHTEVTVMG